MFGYRVYRIYYRIGYKTWFISLKNIGMFWNYSMVIAKIRFYGLALIITWILFASVFHATDVKATILSDIDEPTGNAYEDVYIAEEKNDTVISGLNQTLHTNNNNNTTTK